jgi:hypothetical protein
MVGYIWPPLRLKLRGVNHLVHTFLICLVTLDKMNT